MRATQAINEARIRIGALWHRESRQHLQDDAGSCFAMIRRHIDVPRPRTQARYFKPVAAIVVVAVLSLAAISWFAGGRLIAPAPNYVGAAPAELDAQEIELLDRSGRVVRGWSIAADSPVGVAVLLHGLRGTRRSMLPRAIFLRSAGYSSVLIDLHAHGESEGDVISLGARESKSVQAAVDHVRSQNPNNPIVVLGVSLGGASALLAPDLDVDCLILESVYPDIERAVRNRVQTRLGRVAALPAWLLTRQIPLRLGVDVDDLRPIDRMRSIDCDVLVIGGELDAYTPPGEARELFEAGQGNNELWIVEGAGHVDLYDVAVDEYEERLLEFLRRVQPQ